MQRRTKKLTRPNRRISLILYIYIFITVAVITSVFTYLTLISSDIGELHAQYGVPDSAVASLQMSMTQAMILTVASGVALFLLSVLMNVAIQARVFGPEVPIRRLINQLRDGEYGAKAGLRKEDEFKELMNDLNVLSAKLAERHGTKAASPS